MTQRSGYTSSGAASSGSTIGGFSDSATFELLIAETLAAKSDSSLYDLDLTLSESNAALSELLTVEPFLTDSVAGQSESRGLLARLGATTVAQTAITGTGWVSPANSQGLNDSVNTTITGSGTTATTSAGTLTGSFVTLGTVANETPTGTIDLTFFGVALTVGLLGSGSISLQYSTNGSTYTTLQTLSATTASTAYSFTITGVTLATVSSLTWRAVATVTGTTLNPSSATLDAGVVTFQTAN